MCEETVSEFVWRLHAWTNATNVNTHAIHLYTHYQTHLTPIFSESGFHALPLKSTFDSRPIIANLLELERKTLTVVVVGTMMWKANVDEER